MTLFIRLLDAENKAEAMAEAIAAVREGRDHPRVFEVNPESFAQIPGIPFAYWVSEEVRRLFMELPAFESEERTVKQGLATADDFRFVRIWWESSENNDSIWSPFAKGGNYSPFYSDIHLMVKWARYGAEIKNNLNDKGNVRSNVWMLRDTAANFFFRPGLTWPLRAHHFSPQAMPEGCIFSARGYSAFPLKGEELATLAIFNSSAFDYLFKVLLGRFGYPEFIVGMLQIMPWPEIKKDQATELAKLAKRAWSIQRELDTTNETSHAFVLPALLRAKLGGWDPDALKAELRQIQAEIDAIAFDLYGFSPEDRAAVARLNNTAPDVETAQDDEEFA